MATYSQQMSFQSRDVLTTQRKLFGQCCVIIQTEVGNTHWVGGERPALPQNTHYEVKTRALDRLTPSPGG